MKTFAAALLAGAAIADDYEATASASGADLTLPSFSAQVEALDLSSPDESLFGSSNFQL